ncbi:MAG: acetylglutamate kinase [Saprospiraceae bacterium]|nr:acetylglutamate kinase [Saprospiraceae bacterium]
MTTLLIIKIGGNVLDNPAALHTFLHDFAVLPAPKILVHGGGKIATQIGEKLGLQAQYVQGRRITDDATLELVMMVYGGLINRQLTAQLQALGCNAIGLTGADANILPAMKRPVQEVNYGWVGDLQSDKIDSKRIQLLLHQGLTPVFAPLTHDGEGHLLNTNADTIAATVAVAMTAAYQVRLLFCFEKKGILENPDDDASVVSELNQVDYRKLQTNAAVSGGILPKLDNAFMAAQNGVDRVVIGHAKDIRANAWGTKIVGTLIK